MERKKLVKRVLRLAGQLQQIRKKPGMLRSREKSEPVTKKRAFLRQEVDAIAKLVHKRENDRSKLVGLSKGQPVRSGFWWVNPFYSKKKVSRRLETLECGPLKVNDAVGNPIDIGAVIVWRVQDAAKAVLEVESYAAYVKAQSETALRRMASVHPYDQVEVAEAERRCGKPEPSFGDPQENGTDWRRRRRGPHLASCLFGTALARPADLAVEIGDQHRLTIVNGNLRRTYLNFERHGVALPLSGMYQSNHGV